MFADPPKLAIIDLLVLADWLAGWGCEPSNERECTPSTRRDVVANVVLLAPLRTSRANQQAYLANPSQSLLETSAEMQNGDARNTDLSCGDEERTGDVYHCAIAAKEWEAGG